MRKGKSMLMVKTSAGCSMSEATNDLGWMHSILHWLFKSKDFTCRMYDDPPGPLYSKLKKYLQQYLAPASFQTYWRCIIAMRYFMRKAFTPLNVFSALKLGGFEGDTINKRVIMGHNLEFAKLPEDKSNLVLSLIDSVFAPYWWNNALIHENIFKEVFDGEEDVDTLADRTGKPLNELATNRQRFMMDNHEAWFAEIDRRKEVDKLAADLKAKKISEREAEQAAKPRKSRKCSNPACSNLIDISNAKLKRDNESLWKKCTGKNCPIWGCPDHFDMVENHMIFCDKILL